MLYFTSTVLVNELLALSTTDSLLDQKAAKLACSSISESVLQQDGPCFRRIWSEISPLNSGREEARILCQPLLSLDQKLHSVWLIKLKKVVRKLRPW